MAQCYQCSKFQFLDDDEKGYNPIFQPELNGLCDEHNTIEPAWHKQGAPRCFKLKRTP